MKVIIVGGVAGGATTALATFQYLNAITPASKREFSWPIPEDVLIVEICEDSGLPRNHTCVNTKPLTFGGNVDLSSQCPIDHIRSGTTRRESETNDIITEEEEKLYYTPLDEDVENSTAQNNNNGNNNPQHTVYANI